MDSSGSGAAAEVAQLCMQGLEHICMHVIMSMVNPGLKAPSLCKALRWNDVSRVDMDT